MQPGGRGWPRPRPRPAVPPPGAKDALLPFPPMLALPLPLLLPPPAPVLEDDDEVEERRDDEVEERRDDDDDDDDDDGPGARDCLRPPGPLPGGAGEGSGIMDLRCLGRDDEGARELLLLPPAPVPLPLLVGPALEGGPGGRAAPPLPEGPPVFPPREVLRFVLTGPRVDRRDGGRGGMVRGVVGGGGCC